jgi:hypothetical protein
MNEEQRRLLLARQTWRSMHPNEMEVLRAAKRIASRFQPRRSLSFGRRVRMVSGALATIAGIAYAGSGAWSEIAGKLGGGRAARALADEQTNAMESRTSGPHDPKTERVGVVPEHFPVDAPPSAPAEVAPKAARKKVVRAAAPRARRAEGADSTRNLTASVDLIDNPSWADVNAALGTLDYPRAESLLLRLAEGWRDADTRAKAHLGLAQLAASRGDCERARVLALGVAAAPGIEMKTVRRALELAVRCAR